jgi:hypothetical protein
MLVPSNFSRIFTVVQFCFGFLVFGSITGLPSRPCTSKQTRLVLGAAAGAGVAAGAGAAAVATTVGAAVFGSSLAQATVPNANIPANTAVANNFIMVPYFLNMASILACIVFANSGWGKFHPINAPIATQNNVSNILSLLE